MQTGSIGPRRTRWDTFAASAGAARDALEDAATRLGDAHAEWPRRWAYAGAARAMMGHIDAAVTAGARAGDDEVGAVLRGFVRVARAKDAATRGEAVDLSGLNDAAKGSVEVCRAAELLGALARSIARGRNVGGVRFEVAGGGGWFRLEDEGEGVDLTRRRALRGVLRGLVDRRVSAPGEPMTLDEVRERGRRTGGTRSDRCRSRWASTDRCGPERAGHRGER